MRSKFSEFYRPSTEEFKLMWDEGIFVFDTNVLLDFFRYSEETVKSLFTILDKIKSRIWVPHQVAQEYHIKLNKIICEQAETYEKAIKELNEFNNKFKEPRKHPFLDTDLQKEIEDFSNKIVEKLKLKKDEIKGNVAENQTKSKHADIVNDSVGEPFSEEEMSKLIHEGAERYKKSIPPGYLDKNKPGNDGYGDFIIWKEIIKLGIEKKKPIIFVTGDNKEDWFQSISGLTIGPRPELLKEIKQQASIPFYIYATGNFINTAKSYFDLEIDKNVINEVEEKSIVFQSHSVYTESSIDSVYQSSQVTLKTESKHNIGTVSSDSLGQIYNESQASNSKI